MTFDSTEISAPARYSSLPTLMAAVSRRAAGLGLDAATVQRLQLVLEELFANTINHGHQGECDQPVSVATRFCQNTLTLRYIDHGPPFDIKKNAPAEPSTAIIGGKGLPLIHAMSKRIGYRRSDGRNIIEVDF